MTASENLHQINLFCFPFAGASFYAYKPFEKYLPNHIRVVGIDLPGHGRRMREPLLTDIKEMVRDIWAIIKDDLNFPYAFYGHSLGTLLAYELTVRVIRQGKPLPLRLFLSGRAGPSVSKNRDVYLLPKAEFIKKVTEYDGTPGEVIQSAELMDLMEPILRADFRAVGTYRHQETSPLPMPITIMFGSDDKEVTYEEALKWQEVASDKIAFRRFTGNHFFIFEHTPEICKIIRQDLEKSLSSV